MIQTMGAGCFVHDTRNYPEDSSGIYSKVDMLPKYFPSEIAADLQEMINETSSPNEVVAAVIFEDRMAGTKVGGSGKEN